MTKTSWIIAIAALAAVTFALAAGCRLGWDAGFCVESRATIAPFIHSAGEFMLTEVMSLVACLLGLLIAYSAYIDGDARGVRLAALFIVFFTIAFVGENNLMRDDIRPQMLIVLLVWLTVEMLIARSPGAIALLVLGVLVPALGQLGDHTTQIQFENLFHKPIADSVLAPWARAFGDLEEPLELAGWFLFVTAAAVGLDLRSITNRRVRFMALALVGIAAIAVGNTFLHVRDNDTFEALRKFGLFCSVAGVALVGAAMLLRHRSRGPLALAYCAMMIVVAYWIAVYAPAVYRHEHSKTISSWLWIFPVFTGYYALVSFRRAYARAAAAEPVAATQAPA
jgi:hypothetical protein